jgi:putative acetyltransferase
MIREENPRDASAIRDLLVQAFGSPAEADIVDALRLQCRDQVSLVAERKGAVVGHILFTPVVIDTGHAPMQGYGLAPLAVRPDAQRRGVGSTLVRAGIERVARLGAPFIVVIGHPEYYPRFGFVPASAHGVRCQWEGIPDPAVMIHLLDPSVAARLGGVARYRPEFG